LALVCGLAEWISGYNHLKGHSSLGDRTLDEVYCGLPHPFTQAADACFNFFNFWL
jgi:hypothetical protein